MLASTAGYTPSFGTRVTTEPTLINGGPTAALADGDTKVILQRLVLNGGPSTTSSYGLRAINGASIVLEGVIARGGVAGVGATGVSPGGQPPRATPGGNGQSGICDNLARAVGGARGSEDAGAGGIGGAGNFTSTRIGGDGEPGTASYVATGSSSITQAGQNGGTGAGGSVGASATSPAFTVELAGGQWLGAKPVLPALQAAGVSAAEAVRAAPVA